MGYTGAGTEVGDDFPHGYDEVAEAYNAWVGADVLADDETLVDLIGDIEATTVLALACGQGRDARLLASLGAYVVGVDASARLLGYAIEREALTPTGIDFRLDDARALRTVADGSVDGVLCHMALMDIPDLTAVLRSVARVLRPGGWFVFTINHPCFKPPATGELLNHRDGSSSRVVGRYFDEGPSAAPVRDHDALPATTYHRTLSTYVKGLTAAGLVIEELAEPPGTASGRPVWRSVPQLLYARCRAPLNRSL